MDIVTLKDRIEKARQADPFHVSGADLQSADITKLLTAYLTADLLALHGASKIGETDTTITISGLLDATVIALPGLRATATFRVVNSAAQVSIALAGLPPAWKPSRSFPSLANSLFDDFTYDTPTLLLDSAGPSLAADFPGAYGYPAYPAALRARVAGGLTLHARLSVAGAGHQAIRSFMGAGGWNATGTIALVQNVPSIVLRTDPVAPVSIFGFDIPFQFTLVAAMVASPGGSALAGAVTTCVQLEADIDKDLGDGESLRIPVLFRQYSSSNDVVVIESNLDAVKDLAFEKITKLIAGASTAGTIPSEFPELKNIHLEQIDLSYDVVRNKPLAVSATVSYKNPSPWGVFDGLIEFQGMHVTFALVDPGGLNAVEVDVGASAVISSGTLEAAISLPDLAFSCELTSGAIDIAALLRKAAPVKVTPGDEMPTLRVTELAVFGCLAKAQRYFQLRAALETSWSFNIGSTPLRLDEIRADITYTPDSPDSTSGQMVGLFTIAKQDVFVAADYSGGTWVFEGGSVPGQQFSLSDLVVDLATKLGVPGASAWTLPPILLQDVSFQFAVSNREFAVACTIDLPNASISLSDLPLFGSQIASDVSLALKEIRVAAGTGAGLSVSPQLQLGAESSVSFDLHFGGENQKNPAVVADALALRPAADAAAWPAAAQWFPIQKSFGPLHVDKVGVALNGGGLEVLLNASVDVAALSIGLDGLGVIVPLVAPYTPGFALQGLAIAYHTSAVSIEGGFQRIVNPDQTVEYSGQALIHAESFTLSAIGSYATIGGHPSLFLFALLDAPLGGPSFCFVTGVAAGFGFNRALLLPTLDALPQFPLVQAAMAASGSGPFANASDNPAAALQVLQQYIPPATGESWLAAGVRFTSFQMIQSFALLTVSFGTTTEIALLGLSALTVPTNVPAGEDPIGFAEMSLEVKFSPATGLLSVDAKLTPESYILEKACHLTGGFSLYIWFAQAPGGPPAGEFVVTLGGYHPAFKPPNGYPSPPRIGFDWQVNENLTLKGGMYFALTPRAVMAGGSLEATWQSGDLRAWFDSDIDFLLAWKPFHYIAHASLSLGASYRVNLLFTSFTLTVHLGVALDLWGPSFAGTVYVDLCVVSFTISFGTSSPKADPISWSDFKTSFLPPHDAGSAPDQPALARFALRPANSAPVATDTYCTSRVSNGLVKDLGRDTAGQDRIDWVVSGSTLEIVTHSLIPSTDAQFTSGNGSTDKPGPKTIPIPATWNTNGFGVGPVGIANGSFVSSHMITVYRIEAGKPDYTTDLSAALARQAIPQHVPAAAWSKDAALNPNIAAMNTSPSTIENTLAGFRLFVQPAPDPSPLSIDLAALESPAGTNFSWAKGSPAAADSFNQAQAASILASTIQSDPAASQRSALLTALAAWGIAVDATVDVSNLANSNGASWQSSPLLSVLGEEHSVAAAAAMKVHTR